MSDVIDDLFVAATDYSVISLPGKEIAAMA
jgi:hypothetical protein